MGSAYDEWTDDWMKGREIETAKVAETDVPEISGTIIGLRDGRTLYRLSRPVKWRYVGNGITLRVRVPVGYETDLASVPRLSALIFPPAGPWRFAAVIHDYLCEADGVERAVADAIFWQIMGETKGVGRLRRVVIYGAVRAYWICWRKWTRTRRRSDGQRKADHT